MKKFLKFGAALTHWCWDWLASRRAAMEMTMVEVPTMAETSTTTEVATQTMAAEIPMRKRKNQKSPSWQSG